MAKDWNYWKNEYLVDQIESATEFFKRIEKQTMSPIESIACLYLREFANNNFKPLELSVDPQSKIGSYTVDFLVIHQEYGLYVVIECDGHEFHEKTKKQASHDKKRDRYLAKQGYIVLRYTGSQICENPQEMIDDLVELVIQKMEHSAS